MLEIFDGKVIDADGLHFVAAAFDRFDEGFLPEVVAVEALLDAHSVVPNGG